MVQDLAGPGKTNPRQSPDILQDMLEVVGCVCSCLPTSPTRSPRCTSQETFRSTSWFWKVMAICTAAVRGKVSCCDLEPLPAGLCCHCSCSAPGGVAC